MGQKPSLIDVSPAFHNMGDMLWETGWLALYILLFFVGGEIFLYFASSRIFAYPQLQPLIDLVHLILRLTCLTYAIVFVIAAVAADLGFGLWHYIQRLKEQNKTLQEQVEKMSTFTPPLQIPVPSIDDMPDVAIGQSNQKSDS
jgi:hypothetical protein